MVDEIEACVLCLFFGDVCCFKAFVLFTVEMGGGYGVLSSAFIACGTEVDAGTTKRTL
jgi:hypothetical protein